MWFTFFLNILLFNNSLFTILWWWWWRLLLFFLRRALTLTFWLTWQSIWLKLRCNIIILNLTTTCYKIFYWSLWKFRCLLSRHLLFFLLSIGFTFICFFILLDLWWWWCLMLCFFNLLLQLLITFSLWLFLRSQ